jgi:hypothetical protein
MLFYYHTNVLTKHNRLKTPSKPTTGKKSKSGERIRDSAQLKGALWPGMDLFDSATPEMKRMRNQRKDSNVMRQMKARSAEIEPAEISYFADGEFRASRDIFGPLSDAESPVCLRTFSSKHLILQCSQLPDANAPTAVHQIRFRMLILCRSKILHPRGNVGLASQPSQNSVSMLLVFDLPVQRRRPERAPRSNTHLCMTPFQL